MPETRGGFTLVEVVISMAVLTGGILAAAAALGAASRMVSEGRNATVAAALAASRIELIRSDPCPPPQNGSLARGSREVSWSVAPEAGGRRIVVVTRTPGLRGPQVSAVSTLVWCRP